MLTKEKMGTWSAKRCFRLLVATKLFDCLVIATQHSFQCRHLPMTRLRRRLCTAHRTLHRTSECSILCRCGNGRLLEASEVAPPRDHRETQPRRATCNLSFREYLCSRHASVSVNSIFEHFSIKKQEQESHKSFPLHSLFSHGSYGYSVPHCSAKRSPNRLQIKSALLSAL